MNTKSYHDKLNAYLNKNRLKSTRQRDVIVDSFLKTDGKHIKIEELLAIVRKQSPNIGYATVYRTLLLLVDAGIAFQRHFNDGQSCFEVQSAHHHDHLICTECRKIIEFENETIEELQEQIAKRNRFKLTGHKMELYGICADCRKET